MNAMSTHLAAINSGTVTKTNVIGIRKALNHVQRLRAGWPGNRSNATADEVSEIERRLRMVRPTVTGKLHDSGLKLLRDPRYAKRFDWRQRSIIEHRDARFSLVGYECLGRAGVYAVPVYEIYAPATRGALAGDSYPAGEWHGGGKFLFYNVPWQQTAFQDESMRGPQFGLEGRRYAA
jgi:hypothetical protein